MNQKLATKVYAKCDAKFGTKLGANNITIFFAKNVTLIGVHMGAKYVEKEIFLATTQIVRQVHTKSEQKAHKKTKSKLNLNAKFVLIKVTKSSQNYHKTAKEVIKKYHNYTKSAKYKDTR